MSYCRFSSDDFRSDVYVYWSFLGGITTHVAGSKVVFDESLPPEVPFPHCDVRAFVEREIVVLDIVKRSRRVPIGLPNDGATFSDATPGACADRLEALRAEGYRVPQSAIDALRAEACEWRFEAARAADAIADTELFLVGPHV